MHYKTKITTGQMARKLARDLRNNPTKSELILWNALRKRKLLGYKFLRQHPLFFNTNNQRRFFIADFYCHELKLVIEVDGKIHLKQKEKDRNRDEIFGYRDFHVVRFTNTQIINNLPWVVTRLKSKIDKIKKREFS